MGVNKNRNNQWLLCDSALRQRQHLENFRGVFYGQNCYHLAWQIRTLFFQQKKMFCCWFFNKSTAKHGKKSTWKVFLFMSLPPLLPAVGRIQKHTFCKWYSPSPKGIHQLRMSIHETVTTSDCKNRHHTQTSAVTYFKTSLKEPW